MRRFFCLMTCMILCGALFSAEQIPLVKNGKANFRIVTADKMTQWGELGAKDLAYFTQKVTGATVKTVPISKLPEEKEDLINIFIGSQSYGNRYSYQYPIPAGFRVIFPDKRNIIIAGSPLAGEEFNTNDGVYWFIEKYLGVRFLMPGELGEYIPARKLDIRVPVEDVQQIPSFFARQISGVHGQAYSNKERYEQNAATKYAMRVGMSGSVTLKLNHNVGNLIDPEIYAESHPEFFPLINGKRHIPPKVDSGHWKLYNWEPCYTAPGIAEEAAKNVIKYFDENPTIYSCSLSVNDSGEICECENCRLVNKDLPKGSESQTYYEWVSKVVDIVKQKYPNRNYGVLNYWVTKELPKKLKLDKSVVPIVCEDFHYYVVPELYEKLEARLKEWDNVASTIGWWDYSFEGDYMIPAYAPHFRAKEIKHLYHNHNMRVYTDEMHPSRNFKIAPEVYMLMKLLWNVEADPDALLNEWFNLAVGPEAAPYLKEYFNVWEEIWAKKIPETSWFKERAALGAPFLQRRDGHYLDAISYEDVERAMTAISKAVELAPAGREKQRAEFFYRYISMATDSYFLPYLNSKHLQKLAGDCKGKLLKTYDFATGYAPWVSWQSEKHTAILRHTAEVGHNEEGALELNFDESMETGMVFYLRPLEFKVEPGKNYRLSVWCRGEGVKESDSASMVLFFQKKGGLVLGRDFNSAGALSLRSDLKGKVLNSGVWQKMSLCVSVPETGWKGEVGINCQLEAYVSKFHGKVFYDDFTIEEIDVPGFKPHYEYKVTFDDTASKEYIDPETGEKLGPELVKDGDMEMPDMSLWFDSYTPALREKCKDTVHSGKQAMHIVSDSAGDGVGQLIKPTVLKELFELPVEGFKVGSTYRVQLWVKNKDTSGYNEFRFPGSNKVKMPLQTQDNEWHKISYLVKYETKIPTNYFSIAYGTEHSDMYVDDVSIREVLP